MARETEKRRATRIPLDIPAEFTSRGLGELPGVVKDISLGGAFIETAFPAAFGASVLVGFTLPGQRKPLLVSGTVRWTSKSGMGIQFGLLGAQETHAITEIARRPAGSQ